LRARGFPISNPSPVLSIKRFMIDPIGTVNFQVRDNILLPEAFAKICTEAGYGPGDNKAALALLKRVTKG
jgi:hypothetical protein